MIININRTSFHDYCTLGELYIDGKFQCYTLEDTIRAIKIKSITAISEGVYNLDLRYSPRFSPKYGHDMIWVKDVPGYQFILIHKGNIDSDTEGCLLVGDTKGILKEKKAVLNSKSAYDRIYPIISKAIIKANEDKCNNEKVTIVYTNIKTKII